VDESRFKDILEVLSLFLLDMYGFVELVGVVEKWIKN